MRVRLWEPYARNANKQKLLVTTLVWEINCVVDHAKLPNLVIVAVVGFIYFWRKVKAFRPLEGGQCGEIQFEWNHVVGFYSQILISR